MENNEQNYLEWLKKAQEDELSIQAILKEGGAPSTACFLAQQMAEKYLKGLLVFYKKSFAKVHDLLRLETLLLESMPNTNTIHNNLKLLNRFYIETRYPGDYPEFNFEEARDAYEAAKRVKEFVSHNIHVS